MLRIQMVPKIIRPLVIISPSNDSNLTHKGSLDSSRQEESNGRSWRHELATIRFVSMRRIQ